VAPKGVFALVAPKGVTIGVFVESFETDPDFLFKLRFCKTGSSKF
jgi:hypothetical protein